MPRVRVAQVKNTSSATVNWHDLCLGQLAKELVHETVARHARHETRYHYGRESPAFA